jgi:putative transposase
MGSGIYHVLNRGLNNSWILSREKDRDYFLELLDTQRRNFTLSVYHYAIMSNHFHLAIEALETRELSAYVGTVCSLYSRYWHRNNGGGRGPIWQGRYKSTPVQKDGYMVRLGRYIERNPIAAKVEGVEEPWQYRWTSAKAYVEGADDPLVTGRHNPYWNRLGKNDDERRKTYAAYIRLADADDAKLFSGPATVIGDEGFSAKVRMNFGRPTIRRAGRPRKNQ